MTGGVVPLDQSKRRRTLHSGGDDAGFMVCPVCEGEDLAVVCRGIAARPFVAALVCVGACDGATEISVVGGYIGGVVA